MADLEHTGPTPEDVQASMADTRAHLGGQVAALGDTVMGMVHDASTATTAALQGVTDTAHAFRGVVRLASTGGLSLVKHVFDVRRHVRYHPWFAVGIAAALGFGCARLFRSR